jgi:hypothetical protein
MEGKNRIFLGREIIMSIEPEEFKERHGDIK